MKRDTPVQLGGAWVAAVIAIGVVATFSKLQDFGPESAIRKFNEAIETGNVEMLNRVSEKSVNDADTKLLAAKVVQFMQSGARYKILQMDRGPRRVFAGVAYVLPNGQAIETVWVVDKIGRSWRVNATDTISQAKRSLGF